MKRALLFLSLCACGAESIAPPPETFCRSSSLDLIHTIRLDYAGNVLVNCGAGLALNRVVWRPGQAGFETAYCYAEDASTGGRWDFEYDARSGVSVATYVDSELALNVSQTALECQ
jgi:hypothetical protein